MTLSIIEPLKTGELKKITFHIDDDDLAWCDDYKGGRFVLLEERDAAEAERINSLFKNKIFERDGFGRYFVTVGEPAKPKDYTGIKQLIEMGQAAGAI